MNKFLIGILLFISAITVAQSERYTKGAENGYTWIAMEKPAVAYSDAKYNYLSGMLEKYRTLNEKFPEVAHLGCKNNVNILLEDGMSDKLSLNDMVDAIDKFYSTNENLATSIVFAYCFCIKALAGINTDKLENYRKEILEFCEE